MSSERAIVEEIYFSIANDEVNIVNKIHPSMIWAIQFRFNVQRKHKAPTEMRSLPIIIVLSVLITFCVSASRCPYCAESHKSVHADEYCTCGSTYDRNRVYENYKPRAFCCEKKLEYCDDCEFFSGTKPINCICQPGHEKVIEMTFKKRYCCIWAIE